MDVCETHSPKSDENRDALEGTFQMLLLLIIVVVVISTRRIILYNSSQPFHCNQSVTNLRQVKQLFTCTFLG